MADYYVFSLGAPVWVDDLNESWSWLVRPGALARGNKQKELPGKEPPLCKGKSKAIRYPPFLTSRSKCLTLPPRDTPEFAGKDNHLISH